MFAVSDRRDPAGVDGGGVLGALGIAEEACSFAGAVRAASGAEGAVEAGVESLALL